MTNTDEGVLPTYEKQAAHIVRHTDDNGLHGTEDRDLIVPGQITTLADVFHLYGHARDDIKMRKERKNRQSMARNSIMGLLPLKIESQSLSLARNAQNYHMVPWQDFKT